ncbi:unnamed protein product [Didymodactylos carnosus]|uniref:Uncharacterized protein n=1 Tax=Didymodactylos carnosus TaxID=1234261 RepID=A0A815S6T7_9BILA|nr:unnamed protein product [Didymodactylos carnosus]CAF1485728.1 unnamed protein product [Didymodactylos carnosus]CAF3764731.1 unnamed protein product [Didymodactylos carnosus]CAF4349812.1 unnamed protein product [Didymodactylos carnosus]
MIESQSQNVRPILSITPRKKSVRFNATSPRLTPHLSTNTHVRPQQVSAKNENNKQKQDKQDKDRDHLIVPATHTSYSLPLRNNTTNIDHITNDKHFQNLLSDKQHEYVPTTRGLQIKGEKKIVITTATTNGGVQSKKVILEDFNKFMKTKAEDLRRNMVTVTGTFNEASKQLNSIKEGKER